MFNGEDKVKEYFRKRGSVSNSGTRSSTGGIPGEDKVLEYFAKKGHVYEPGPIRSADEKFQRERTERILEEHRGRQPQTDVESSDDRNQVFRKNPTSERYSKSTHSGRSGKFGSTTIPFRGAGGAVSSIPEQDTFGEIMLNRDFNSKAATGWQKYLSDQESKRAEREAAEEWLRKPHIGVDPMTKVVMGMTIDDSYKLPSDQWTQEERDVFGLLYETDKDKAEQFAIDTNNSYKQKEQNRQIGEVKQFADEHPVAATVMGNTAQALGVGMADFMTSGIEKMARGTITQRGFVSPSQASEAATGRVAENLNDKFGTIKESVPVFGGRGLGDAYQLLNSVVVSAATANTAGPLGTDLIFFGNAAASAMDDAKKRGATDDQALTMALISGTAEAAGEHFSASHLLEMTDTKNNQIIFRLLVWTGV